MKKESLNDLSKKEVENQLKIPTYTCYRFNINKEKGQKKKKKKE